MLSVFKIRSCADNDPAVLEVLVRKTKRKTSKLEGKESESGKSRHHCLISDLIRKVFKFSSMRVMFTVTL